ncbi:hypothetical protein DFH09DRAFT_1080452 [Mycena vulgaris]|nr:hypothetical protein DFH09DRAFT_1080452 [Mycena vulgaris]
MSARRCRVTGSGIRGRTGKYKGVRGWGARVMRIQNGMQTVMTRPSGWAAAERERKGEGGRGAEGSPEVRRGKGGRGTRKTRGRGSSDDVCGISCGVIRARCARQHRQRERTRNEEGPLTCVGREGDVRGASTRGRMVSAGSGRRIGPARAGGDADVKDARGGGGSPTRGAAGAARRPVWGSSWACSSPALVPVPGWLSGREAAQGACIQRGQRARRRERAGPRGGKLYLGRLSTCCSWEEEARNDLGAGRSMDQWIKRLKGGNKLNN